MRSLLGSRPRVKLLGRGRLRPAPTLRASDDKAGLLGRWRSRLAGGVMIGLLMSFSSAFQFALAPSPDRVAEQALQAASVPANVAAPDVEGRLALARRDYAEAATYYELSITRSPKLKEGYLGAASAFSLMGHFDRADVYFGLYNRHFGEDLAFMNDYGFSLALRGEVDKALAYLMAAQRRAPNSPTVTNNLELIALLQEGQKLARKAQPSLRSKAGAFWSQ